MGAATIRDHDRELRTFASRNVLLRVAGPVYDAVSNTALPCAHTVKGPYSRTAREYPTPERDAIIVTEVPSGFSEVSKSVQSGSVNHRL